MHPWGAMTSQPNFQEHKLLQSGEAYSHILYETIYKIVSIEHSHCRFALNRFLRLFTIYMYHSY